MSLIKLQQTQMSGTLVNLVDDKVSRENLLKPNRSLVDDLNALRTQIKNIQGTDTWTTELSGSQSLSVIEGAMEVGDDGTTVDFTGDVYVKDDTFVSGSLQVAEIVKAFGGFSGSLTKLSGGGDYLLAGKNITTNTGALGDVEIVANPGSAANGVQYNVDGYFTANDKFTFTMTTDDSNYPMGKLVMSGTFVQGNNSIAIGEYSHAAGYATQAIGPRSQALGNETIAGYFSITNVSINAGGDLVLEKADLSGLTTPITAYVAKDTYFEPVQITINSITLVDGDSILSITGGALIPAGAGGVELIFDASDAAGLEQVGAAQTGAGTASRGQSTRAWGDYSSARGNSTKALGLASHAEGGDTDALGDWSHAEGYLARAHGESSHAEGHQAKTGAADHLNLWSGGLYAHAEGSNTRAYGEASHAEGIWTFAIGAKSHAEGGYTFAGGFEIPAEVSGDSLKFAGDVESRLQAMSVLSILFIYGTEVIALTLLNGTQVYDEETNSTTISVAENTDLVEASGYVISTDSIWIGHSHASVVGDYSHAEGFEARALGDHSHAEGVSSYALGEKSHAEGINTTTIGFGSHAEGELSVAKGNGSHAEGYMTTGSANYSHSEGESTLASGVASHAEGAGSMALGMSSHAEGSVTKALGMFSHAEGREANSVSRFSHAEGSLTATGIVGFPQAEISGGFLVISGLNSGNKDLTGLLPTADGFWLWNRDTGEIRSTPVSNPVFEAESGNTKWEYDTGLDWSNWGVVDIFLPPGNLLIHNWILNGAVEVFPYDNSGIARQNSQVNLDVDHGYHSHAEGERTAALGKSSHAEGINTIAWGIGSHAEGESTSTRGAVSHAEGYMTIGSGGYSHAEGESTLASGVASHAEGYMTTGSAEYSHSEGRWTESLGLYSHAEGDLTQAGKIVWAATLTDNQLTFNGDATAEWNRLNWGGSNTVRLGIVTPVYAQVISDGRYLAASPPDPSDVVYDAVSDTTTINITFVDVSTNTNVSPNYTNESVSVWLLTAQNSWINQISLGNADVSISAGASASHAEGYITRTWGMYSHAEGEDTIAIGIGSHAEGKGASSIGDYSHAEGKDTAAVGFVAHAEGQQADALGDYSHAEGYLSKAISSHSHAEGNVAIAGRYALWPIDFTGDTITISGDLTALFEANSSFSYFNNGFLYTLGVVSSAYDPATNVTTIVVGDDFGFVNEDGPMLSSNVAWSKVTGVATIGSEFAHAEGSFTQAWGAHSHAEGYNTLAIGLGSHAEGSDTRTFGERSHAEGQSAVAVGDRSHAEGYGTLALGNNSHSDGSNTTAGAYSLVIQINRDEFTVPGDLSNIFGTGADFEGFLQNGAYISGLQVSDAPTYNPTTNLTTFALYNDTYLEGVTATVYGKAPYTWHYYGSRIGHGSNSSGDSTWAVEENSKAEGLSTVAWAVASHAEGLGSRAYGAYSHAEGEGDTYGAYSHAEAQGVALADSSHAEGSGKAGAYYFVANIANDEVTLSGDKTSLFGGGETIRGKTTSTLQWVVVDQTTSSYDEETGLTTLSLAIPTGITDTIKIYSNDISWWRFGAGIEGERSHAEGSDSVSTGGSSHAEGLYTRAVGIGAHSEGTSTVASGDLSHAEGHYTIASGYASHAEGSTTISLGDYSHAEGYMTTGSANYSHSEGRWTESLGLYSHAEGDLTTAGGAGSHAEGSGSLAMGLAAHAEGYLSSAPANYSHAEGWAVIASGSWSHAEGKATITSGSWSHAEGIFSIARGEGSHAEGSGSLATGVGSHAEGKDTTALGNFSHAEGVGTLASGYGSIAMGFGAAAAGNFSVAAGDHTVASGSYQTVFGRWNKENNGDSVFIIGGGTEDSDRRDLMLVGQNTIMMGSASLAPDTFFFVSGSIGSKAAGEMGVSLFGGDAFVSGTMYAEAGFSGSLTKLVDGSDYLVAGVGVSVSVNPNGSITIGANTTNSIAKGYYSKDDGYLTGGVFNFGPAAGGGSGLGTLSTVSDKFIDVYINGVFLTYGTGKDFHSLTNISFALNTALANELNSTDVISVVLRNIA